MKLEDQVVSLELAKKLKELGVKQESLFFWIKLYDSTIILNHCLMRKPTSEGSLYSLPSTFQESNHFSAFTVAELGEMLPSKIENEWIEVNRCADLSGWNCTAGYIDSIRKAISFCEKTEADARAKILIHLIENKLIDINLINNE